MPQCRTRSYPSTIGDVPCRGPMARPTYSQAVSRYSHARLKVPAPLRPTERVLGRCLERGAHILDRNETRTGSSRPVIPVSCAPREIRWGTQDDRASPSGMFPVSSTGLAVFVDAYLLWHVPLEGKEK
jgi:hypothetical protein